MLVSSPTAAHRSIPVTCIVAAADLPVSSASPWTVPSWTLEGAGLAAADVDAEAAGAATPPAMVVSHGAIGGEAGGAPGLAVAMGFLAVAVAVTSVSIQLVRAQGNPNPNRNSGRWRMRREGAKRHRPGRCLLVCVCARARVWTERESESGRALSSGGAAESSWAGAQWKFGPKLGLSWN